MAKPSWITLDKSSGTGGGSVEVTAATNENVTTRSGSLTVQTTSGITKNVSITQLPGLSPNATISISGSPSMTVDAASGTVTFSGITCTNTQMVSCYGSVYSGTQAPAQVSRIVIGDTTWAAVPMVGSGALEYEEWTSMTDVSSATITYVGLGVETVIGVTATICVSSQKVSGHLTPSIDDSLTLQITLPQES